MILVAGLAIAGLAGIAAAFYFSMRPGGSRVRPTVASRAVASRAGASRAGTSRSPAGRNRTPRAVDRTGPSTVIDFTGPQRVLEDPEPQVTGRRARHSDRPDATADEPAPGRRATARRAAEADAGDGPQTPKSWRRVGWRKGSDVDEELWPAEGFGGVSDEQFWDDLAADKPLATTARTAHPDTASRPAPRQRGPLPELRPGDGRAAGRRASAEGPSTNPQPRLAPDDRTMIQPAVAAPASPTSPMATQPYPMATQPFSSTTQPVRAAYQPPEPRGRSRTGPGADEDPLTSPAYSLRPKGRVDGRGGYPDSVPAARQSGRPSHGPNGPGRPDPQRPDPLRPVDPYAAYPYPQQPYDERYGSGNPSGPRAQAGPAGDPRQANGGSRPAYPPVNGHRGLYNPQGYDRRLASRRLGLCLRETWSGTPLGAWTGR
jgi:hypothetical protein